MLAEGPGFRLLDALLEVGSEGATREHLLRKAELSLGTFYKKIKPLIQAGLIKEQGHRYYLPLSSYAFRFKQWRDWDRLYDLSETVRASVLGVLEEALEVLAEGLECLWLVGSVARAEHTERSDIDFLAIVHDAEADFSPREGAFPVQWVPMTQETFTSKLRQGDEFAVSAIRHGVLLHDGGMAQDFYQVPLNEPSSAFFKEKALVVERFRSRFFESLAVDDLDQARADLASMAQTVIRLIFQRLGEHPGGKPDLLRLLDIYFGSQMGMDFWAAMITSPQKPLPKDSLIRLHRSVSDYYEQFAAKSGLLERVTESLLRGQWAEFESVLGTVLSELFEGLQKSDGGAIDFLLALGDRKLLIEAKTLTGGLTSSQLHQLVKQSQSWGKDSQQRIVLVVNSLRQVPVLERTGLTEAQGLAQELGVVVLYSTQVLRAYHILHLEENHREAVASLGIQGQLIISERLEPSLLQDALLDKLRTIEVILDDWDSDDSEVDAWDFEEDDLEFTINSFFVKDPDQDGLLDISFSYSVSIVAQVTLVTHEAWDQEESRYLIEDKDSGIIEQTLTETGTAVIKCPKRGELKVKEVDLHDLDQIVLSRSLFRANQEEES